MEDKTNQEKWDNFIHQIRNKYDPKSNSWKNTNVCQWACIYGRDDGALWCNTEGF